MNEILGRRSGVVGLQQPRKTENKSWTYRGKGQSYSDMDRDLAFKTVAGNWPSMPIESLVDIYRIRTGDPITVEEAKKIVPGYKPRIDRPLNSALTVDALQGLDTEGLTAERVNHFSKRYVRRCMHLSQRGWVNIEPAKTKTGVLKREIRWSYWDPEDRAIRMHGTTKTLKEAIVVVDNLERKMVPRAFRVLMKPTIEESLQMNETERYLKEEFGHLLRKYNREKVNNLTYDSFLGYYLK